MWESAKAFLGNSLKHDSSSNNDEDKNGSNNNSNSNNSNNRHTGLANGDEDTTYSREYEWSMNTEATTRRRTSPIVTTEELLPYTIEIPESGEPSCTLDVNGEHDLLNDFLVERYEEDLDADVTVTVHNDHDGESDMIIDNTAETINAFETFVTSDTTRSPNVLLHTHDSRTVATSSTEVSHQNDNNSETLSLEDEVVELVVAPHVQIQAEKEAVFRHQRVQDIRSFFTSAVKLITPVVSDNVSSGGSGVNVVRTTTAVKTVRKRLVPWVVVQKRKDLFMPTKYLFLSIMLT